MIIDPGQEKYVAAMDAVLASSLTLLTSWEDQYRDADERLPWVEGGVIARFMAQMVQDDPHSPKLQSVFATPSRALSLRTLTTDFSKSPSLRRYRMSHRIGTLQAK
jgi:hypothetical protein